MLWQKSGLDLLGVGIPELRLLLGLDLQHELLLYQTEKKMLGPPTPRGTKLQPLLVHKPGIRKNRW